MSRTDARTDAAGPPRASVLALALLAPVPLLLLPLLGLGLPAEGFGLGGWEALGGAGAAQAPRGGFPAGGASVALVPRLPFLMAALLAGLVWVGALVHVARRGAPTRRQVGWIVAGAIALRVLGWAGDPGLSDDRYRYVFEGALVLEGRSPWAAAPSSEVRAEHRARWPGIAAHINHPDVPAAYPPVMQAVAALGVGLGGVLDGVDAEDTSAASIARRERFADGTLRALHAALDLALLVPLASLLAARGRSLAWLLAWGACPLVLIAFAGSGHFDAGGVLLMMSALALWDRGREGGGRVLLGLGVLVKFLPVLALVGGLGDRAGRRRAAGVGLVVAVGLGAAALLEGGYALDGLSQYALQWQSTPGLFRLVEPLFEWTGARDGGWGDPRRLARAAIAVLFLGLAWRCVRLRLGPVRSAALMVFGFCLLSPTLHPWYVTWLVPFVGLVPNLGAVHLIAAAPLLYWPVWSWHERGVWEDPMGLFWIVVAPALVLGLWHPWRARARRAA